jgi:hypothetical protein
VVGWRCNALEWARQSKARRLHYSTTASNRLQFLKAQAHCTSTRETLSVQPNHKPRIGYIHANHTTRFDSSVGRGDFETAIGIGRVIRGWDEGVVTMKVGEKATLDITPDYGYGDRGFPGAIPPRSSLIFDVDLKKIN